MNQSMKMTQAPSKPKELYTFDEDYMTSQRNNANLKSSMGIAK